MADGQTFPDFVGWMLWNIVQHEAKKSGADWPAGIFEDQPQRVQTAWNQAATELQHRATTFGRLA